MTLLAATRNALIATALLVILLVGGCKKKKQQPQVAQAPTISTSQTGSTAQPQTKTDSSGNATPQITTTHPAAQVQAQNHPLPPKPKPKKHTPKEPKPADSKKNTPETGGANDSSTPATIAQNNPPPKITIEPSYPDVNGGGAAISATAPHSDDIHNKLSTEQLLQSTDDNLKSIKRALTLDEQSQVVQIRNFMAQSRSAIAGSDSVRARNLALKAHLLSDELLKHR